jgi:hypothetical protein
MKKVRPAGLAQNPGPVVLELLVHFVIARPSINQSGLGRTNPCATITIKKIITLISRDECQASFPNVSMKLIR